MRTLMLVMLALLCPVVATAQGTSFPSNDEITLVVNQGNRAIDQYKAIVAQGEKLLGQDTFESDRMLIAHWQEMADAMKKEPQTFNGRLGFDVILDLDDASRNAALCANNAATQGLKELVGGSPHNTTPLVTLSQSCMDVSSLLYTISESASALYKKTLAWQSEMVAQAADTLQQCQNALKRKTP